MRIRIPLLSLMAATAAVIPVTADDWPQWMGPLRDNVWRETGVITRFPDGGPQILWRTPIAGGYSGPAVAGGRVYVTDYRTADGVRSDNFERREQTGVERVLCLDEVTGQILWQHEYPVRYTVSYPSGPRCTPNVEGDLVWTLGAEGDLYCFETTTGRVLWSVDLKRKYGTKAALWGYAAHPLIDGDRLLCLAGGSGSHIVALDKKTGAEIWRSSTSPEQGYSPPTIIKCAGVRQLVLLKPDAVTSISPETGQEYWSIPYEATNGSIIMSPVFNGEFLYAAGFSSKNLLIRLDLKRPGATEVWRDRSDAISPVNVQPFLLGDVLYGFDQKGLLRALRLPDGELLWETSDVTGKRPAGSETAFLVRQEDHFWLFNELGELLIARLTPDGYHEIDRAKVIEQTNTAIRRDVVWSMPAFASRHAYIRNDREIICVNLAQ